jgi:hypothetical protein
MDQKIINQISRQLLHAWKDFNPNKMDIGCLGRKNMIAGEEVKRATIGFIISLLAGICVLINAAMFVVLDDFLESLGVSGYIPDFVTDIFAGMAAVGLLFAVLVIIGAILIYMPGKEMVGGILVIISSILSIVIGGGFLIGLILGVVGGVLGLLKK